MNAPHRAAFVLLGLALLASHAAAGPTTHEVAIEGMRFSPATLVVRLGDRIVWVNNDLVPHTASAADGKTFASPTLAPGAQWNHVARTQGSFPYLCTLHSTMKAKLVVRP